MAATLVRVILCLLFVGRAFSASATEPAEVLQAFVYQLVQGEKIRQSAISDLDNRRDTLAVCVSTSTSYQLELADSSAKFEAMKLDGEFGELPALMVMLFDKEASLHGRLVEICTAMMKARADSSLTAEFAEIQATLGHNEKSIWEVTPIFIALVMGPPTETHVPLLLTKVERDTVVSWIGEVYETELKKKEHSYLIASALLIRDTLTKNTRASDER